MGNLFYDEPRGTAGGLRVGSIVRRSPAHRGGTFMRYGDRVFTVEAFNEEWQGQGIKLTDGPLGYWDGRKFDVVEY